MIQRIINSSNIRSALIMYLSTVFFSVMGLSVRIIKDTVPPSLMVFYRSIIGTIFVIFLIFLVKRKFKIHNLKFLILRGITGAAALYCYFKAISLINLSEAAMLTYTSPIYSTVTAIIFLKENWNRWTIILMLFAIFGTLLIIKPGFSSFSSGHIFGLLSGVFAGIAMTCVRYLRRSDNSEIIVLAFTTISTLITIHSPFIANISYSPTIIFYLIIIGLCSAIAQLLMSYSYKHLDTQTGSVISLMTVVNIVILSVVLLNEKPDILSVVGGIIIVASSIILSLYKPVKTLY